MKIRTIITQDAEVDDQIRCVIFYSMRIKVELQGIIQTSSISLDRCGSCKTGKTKTK